MSERRILVIGSQCRALPHLAFLPQLAQDLYAVMTDTERGACVSAIEGDGLLIDPTVKKMKAAIKSAYFRAAKDEASLFIAYIGHGEKSVSGDDYYLLPDDAEIPPDSDTAVHLTNLIKEAHRNATGEVDGLGALVDACYSGAAGFGAAQAWVSGLQGTLRFEMLTAAADRPAANGCFSRSLVKLLHAGISAAPSEHLQCVHVRPLIESACPNQVPQNPSYNADETLWLARNVARIIEPWAQTPVADEIQSYTLSYQPTPALGEVVKRSKEQRCLVILGEAGVGKSALAAAVAWPKVSEPIVPTGFVQAIALFNEATTPQALARAVGEQLARGVPGFQETQQAFARETSYPEQQRLDILERKLVEPLKLLKPAEVRLVFDGLDRLATGAAGLVMTAIEKLAELDFMRLLITARPETGLPGPSSIYSLPRTADEDIVKYLKGRGIPDTRLNEIAEAAQGNWLVARVLANLLSQRGDAEIRTAGQLALGEAYDDLLSRCGATSDKAAQRILEVLAAAGEGPLLPLSILCRASKELDGPDTPPRVRDQLVRLRGLAVRSVAGTEREQAGLFHHTLVQHIAARAPDRNRAAHQAIIAAIEVLAPIGTRPAELSDPEQRYAFEREAEHLWVLGEAESAVKRLEARTSPVPRDNLRRFQSWLSRVNETFGPDHRLTLSTRYDIASDTGECGDSRKALRLFQALLADYERVFGPDDADTLKTRNNIAELTGRCGDSREALRLFQALLPDRERVFGPEHRDTLTIRHNIAAWTGECGDSREALRLFQALLPDQERVFGPNDSDTLVTRGNIARWTGECGDAREALRLFQALLADLERVLGPNDARTLTTRNSIAFWTGKGGDPREGLQLFHALLPDLERVLGADHWETLTARGHIAFWIGQCGDPQEALRLSQALLPDYERVRGPNHRNTLEIRHNIAAWTGECGDAREALRLFQALLPDDERVLGPSDSDTLVTRNSIAVWTGNVGDPQEALRLFQALLLDYERMLGADHELTLRTRLNIAYLTGERGEAREALRLSQALFPDCERVLGADHEVTLAARGNIARWTGQCGDTREALRLFQALLPDYGRVLGADHPHTLRMRDWFDQLSQD
jgi:hypothetical protein